MNLAEIFVANGLALGMLAVLQISRYRTRRNRRLDDRLFTVMVSSTMIAAVVEALSFVVDGQPGTFAYAMNWGTNSVMYFMTIMTSSVWMVYVDMHLFRDRLRLKRRYLPALVPMGLLTAGLVINVFFGFFFYVDEENLYHRMPLGYVFYIYMVFSFLVSVFTLVQHRRAFRRSPFFPLPLFLVPVVLCSLVQVVFYGLSLSWAGVAVGLVGVYINLQSRQSFVDSLTGLYNRQFLEHEMFIAREGRPTAYYGIMLDVDQFKAINDRLGHSVGDSALSNTADILLKAVGMEGQIFRYAGDEFVVILKTDRESEVLAAEERIRQGCQAFNDREDHPYQLSVSMGHSRFDPSSDSEDSFLRRIDQRMYEDKKRHRKPALQDRAGVH